MSLVTQEDSEFDLKNCINDNDLITQEEFGPKDIIVIVIVGGKSYCYEVSSLFRWIFETIYPLIPTEEFTSDKEIPGTREKIDKIGLKKLNREYCKFWFRKNLKVYLLFDKNFINTLVEYEMYDIMDEIAKKGNNDFSFENRILAASSARVVNEKYIDTLLCKNPIKDYVKVASALGKTGIERYVKCLESFPIFSKEEKINIFTSSVTSGNLELMNYMMKLFKLKEDYFQPYESIYGREISLMNYFYGKGDIYFENKDHLYDCAARYVAHAEVKKAWKYLDPRKSLVISEWDSEYKNALNLFLYENIDDMTDDKQIINLRLAMLANKYMLIDYFLRMETPVDRSLVKKSLEFNKLSTAFYIFKEYEDAENFGCYTISSLQWNNYLACALLTNFKEEMSVSSQIFYMIMVSDTKNQNLINYCLEEGMDPYPVLAFLLLYPGELKMDIEEVEKRILRDGGKNKENKEKKGIDVNKLIFICVLYGVLNMNFVQYIFDRNLARNIKDEIVIKYGNDYDSSSRYSKDIENLLLEIRRGLNFM